MTQCIFTHHEPKHLCKKKKEIHIKKKQKTQTKKKDKNESTLEKLLPTIKDSIDKWNQKIAKFEKITDNAEMHFNKLNAKYQNIKKTMLDEIQPFVANNSSDNNFKQQQQQQQRTQQQQNDLLKQELEQLLL